MVIGQPPPLVVEKNFDQGKVQKKDKSKAPPPEPRFQLRDNLTFYNFEFSLPYSRRT